MRRLAPFLLAAILTLAGCLGDDDSDRSPDGDGGDGGDGPAGGAVRAFTASGAPVDLPGWASGMEATLRSVGMDGPEPTLGITSEGTVFFQAMTTTLRSTDGGETWESVYEFPRTLDPMLWVDPLTDRVFVNHLYVGCSHLAFSDDAGETWIQNPATCGIPGNDHQKVMTAPARGPVPTVGYPNIVYYCFSGIVQSLCSTSHDGGVTWKGNQAVGPGQECAGGLHGHPGGAPDGTVYLPKMHCGLGLVAITRDGGASWETVQPDPEHGSGGDDNEVAVDAAGNAYYVYTDREGVPRVSVSTDAGRTWHGGWQLSPPDVRHAVFPVAVAGDAGRFAAAYLATDHPGDFPVPDDAPEDARWHLLVTYSLNALDAEPTFVTLRATPGDDPVQVGSICLSGIGCEGGDRNLLDFIDMVIDPAGRVHVAYADGCTEGCAGNEDAKPEDSRDRLGMMAIVEGASLLGSG